MKSKRGRSSSKKDSESRSKENTLLSILLKKHQSTVDNIDKKDQTALLLETILSGSDEELQKILEEWVQ